VLTSAVVVVAIFAAGFVFARFMAEAGMPVPIALVIFGVVAGAMTPGGLHFALGPGILAIFLPALIFEASWDGDAAELRRTAVPIAVLAVPGVLVTTAIVAGACVATHVLPWRSALVLGAIVSATDPVAVLALFRRLRLQPGVVTIVEGESIANDGVAVVLAQALAAFALAGSFAGGPLGAAASILAGSCGGVLVGAGIALAMGLVLRAWSGTPGRIVGTIAVAYAAYMAASALGASGIFATAAAGVTLRAVVRVAPSSAQARTIDRVWDAIAFGANAIVFLLVGLSLRLDRVFGEPLLLVAVTAAVVCARALLAYLLVPLRGLTDTPLAWRHVIALAGLRGGLSLALALGLPAAMPSRDSVVAAVFAVVFLTLVVQGSVLTPILRRLSVAPESATLGKAAGIGIP
jgi:CPA1 family monovalent cation:H+ antiporter